MNVNGNQKSVYNDILVKITTAKVEGTVAAKNKDGNSNIDIDIDGGSDSDAGIDSDSDSDSDSNRKIIKIAITMTK